MVLQTETISLSFSYCPNICYTVYSPARGLIQYEHVPFPAVYVSLGPQRLQSQSIILTASERANQWQLQAHILRPCGARGEALQLQRKQP